jgi:hypothetical protein
MSLLKYISRYSLSMCGVGFTTGMYKSKDIKQNVLDMSFLEKYPKNEYLDLLNRNDKKRVFSGMNLQLREEDLLLKDRVIFSSKYSLDCLLFPYLLFMNIEINKIVDKNGDEYLFRYFEGANRNNFITSSSLF